MQDVSDEFFYDNRMAEVSEYQMNYFPDSTYDYGNNGRMGWRRLRQTQRSRPSFQSCFHELFHYKQVG